MDGNRESDFFDKPLEPREFRWAVEALFRIHRLPVAHGLLNDRYAPPYSVGTICEAAREAELTTRVVPLDDDDTPFPWLCVDREQRIWLFVARRGDQLVGFPSGNEEPEFVDPDGLAERFEKPRLCVESDARGTTYADDDSARPQPFGFRWFIPELMRHRKVWRDILLASFAIQLVGLATPIFTQVIIDKVIVHEATNTLYVIAFGIAAFMTFSVAMTWVRQYLLLHTGNRIDAILGARVFKQLFELPLRYFEKRPTGTLVARVEGIEAIRNFLAGAAVGLFLDLPFLGVFLAIMFYYSWQLTLVAITVLLLISVLSLAVTPEIRRRLNTQFQLGARNQAFLTEYINGVETVKSLQMERRIQSRFDDFLSSYLAAGFRSRHLSNGYGVAASALEQAQVLGILFFGAYLVMRSPEFTVGMLVAFQMFASRLSQPVMRLVGLWQEFQQASIAVKRLGDVMDAPTEPYALVPRRFSGVRGHIEIERLAFRYGDEQPLLYRDLSIDIPAGGCVAVMGPSGSGKSTLGKLLQGFYRPSEGRILIDGQDIRGMMANELRTLFGVVPQETVLFSGTIWENLVVANPHASTEEVAQACRMAEINDTIERLPDGFGTTVGEHGAGLSGGQKQRLAIARALLRKPKVLLFDEATSSLDGPTAEAFGATVDKLKGKVTVVFIAHQIPKTLHVDRIVHLDGAETVPSSAEADGPNPMTVAQAE